MSERDEEGRLRLPEPMRAFAWLSVLSMLLSWVVAVLSWRAGSGERGGMWARYDDRFADLSHYDAIFPFFHQERFFTGSERFAYPAPSAVVYDWLLYLQPHRLGIFLAFSVLVAVVPAVWLGRRLVRDGLRGRDAALFITLTLLGSWPLLFLLERANLEAVLIALTFAGAAAFWRRQMTLASICWGLAAAMKIYPALLLLMFLRPGRLRPLLLGFGTMLGTLLLSFWFVGPTVSAAFRGTLAGIGGFVGTYASHSREWELRHDHSFLAFLKQPLAIHRFHLSTDTSGLSHGYYAVMLVLLPVLFFTLFRKLPDLNRYLLLLIAMVTLPPVSYDYTLMHLYPGFALLLLLLVRERRGGERLPVLRPLLWCFLAIFASENFLFYVAFHLNGMVKAAALLWAAVLLLRTPLPEPPALADVDGAALAA